MPRCECERVGAGGVGTGQERQLQQLDLEVEYCLVKCLRTWRVIKMDLEPSERILRGRLPLAFVLPVLNQRAWVYAGLLFTRPESPAGEVFTNGNRGIGYVAGDSVWRLILTSLPRIISSTTLQAG